MCYDIDRQKESRLSVTSMPTLNEKDVLVLLREQAEKGSSVTNDNRMET